MHVYWKVLLIACIASVAVSKSTTTRKSRKIERQLDMTMKLFNKKPVAHAVHKLEEGAEKAKEKLVSHLETKKENIEFDYDDDEKRIIQAEEEESRRQASKHSRSPHDADNKLVQGAEKVVGHLGTKKENIEFDFEDDKKRIIQAEEEESRRQSSKHSRSPQHAANKLVQGAEKAKNKVVGHLGTKKENIEYDFDDEKRIIQAEEEILLRDLEQTLNEEKGLKHINCLGAPMGNCKKRRSDVNGVRQPNIIFFLVDDLGCNDIGYLNDSIQTPNIDDLATSGAILTNNYVIPVCTPSRMALMSGIYPFKTGFQHLVLTETNPHCADPDTKFLPQRMKELDYTTHMLGKWHLGFCNIECTPTKKGFDTFNGFYAGMESYYDHEVDGFYDFRDGEEIDLDAKGKYGPDYLGEKAIEIITNSDDDVPFFMYFAFPNPHHPIEPKSSDIEKYSGADSERKNYTALISNVDDVIGSIVQSLKDSGKYEDTLLIFSSDNGGEIGVASNYPYRGGKGSYWEGGHHAVGWVHGPEIIQDSGTPRDGMFHITDWTPTLLAIAQGEPIADGEVDGINQYEMIINNGETNRDEYVINIDKEFPPTLGAKGLRWNEYKLIVGNEGFVDGYSPNLQYFFDVYADMATKKRSYDFTSEQNAAMASICEAKESQVLLFNVIEDETETTNIADEHPDIVDEMLEKLKAYEVDYMVPPEDAANDDQSAYPATGGAWSPGWC